MTKRSVAGRPVGNRIRFCTMFLAGAAALTLGCEIADVASWNLEATAEASPQTPARPSPIPAAGPLAEPKSLEQVGVPVEATRAAVPADNPQTPERIVLGQKLFFDGRLSVDGTIACSTCHDPTRAFTDGRPVSIGVNGRVGQRNAPSVLNALYNKTQFWDGRANTLEEQAALPIANPSEMGQPSLDAAVAHIAALPEYRRRFGTSSAGRLAAPV
jgi:cytochrome c peroxidase